MASTALLGFLKGASAQGLDSLNARKAAEAEERKQKLLAQLRVDTEKEMALFTEELPSTKQKRELERKQDERADRKSELDEKKFSLDEMTTKQAMELARNKDAREGQLTGAKVGYYNSRGLDEGSSGEDGGGSVGSASLGATLANEYKDTINDLARSQGVPRYVAEQAAAKVVANVKAANPDASPAQMEDMARSQFLIALQHLGTGSRPAGGIDSEGNPLSRWSPASMMKLEDFVKQYNSNKSQ